MDCADAQILIEILITKAHHENPMRQEMKNEIAFMEKKRRRPRGKRKQKHGNGKKRNKEKGTNRKKKGTRREPPRETKVSLM